jgi:hypothetical protein
MNIEYKDFEPADYKREIEHFEKNTSVSTDLIFHFTRSFTGLCGILSNGFIPFSCKEFPIYLKEYYEGRIFSNIIGEPEQKIEDIEIPMVCFCDIPKRARFKHMIQYGSYGIGLKKSWAISNYMSPVHYIPVDSRTHIISNHMMSHLNMLDSMPSGEDAIDLRVNNLFECFIDYVKYTKQYQDPISKRKYYDEREWRYIPNHTFDVNDPNTYLKFDLSDCLVIYVKTAKERRIVTKLLNNKFKVHIDKKLIKLNK